MTKTLMLGTALAALMLSGAWAQTPGAATTGQDAGGAQLVTTQKPDQ